MRQITAMPLLLLMTCLVLLSCLGCGKTSSKSAAASGATNAGSSAAVSAATLATVLEELTQALRKFGVEQRRVPASLNELVTAGYIQKVPQPPPGKAFAIDPKNLRVVVK